jgi:hypothetical protein
MKWLISKCLWECLNKIIIIILKYGIKKGREAIQRSM